MTSARNVNRFDGSGDTLVSDFMQHTVDSIAPAWAVNTTRAHWQAERGLHLPTEKDSLPKENADGITQRLPVLTLGAPGFEAPKQSQIDVDADGCLEVNFTVLWDGRSLRAHQNRATSNDSTWSLAA